MSHIRPDRKFNYCRSKLNLLQVDKSSHHRVMDHFIKGLHVSLPKNYVLASLFNFREKPVVSFNPCYITS